MSRRYRSEYSEKKRETSGSSLVQKESEPVSETVYGTIVKASCVKIRESPSGDSRVVCFANRGARVLVDPFFEGVWKRVHIKGMKGWYYVLSQYCEVENNGNNERY